MHYNIDDFLNSLTCGDIFYFKGKINNTSYPHYQMVVNKYPNGTIESIFLGIATTKINKKKEYNINMSREDPRTIVEIFPGDIACLNQHCCFDCNSLTQHNSHDLHGYHLSNDLLHVGNTPLDIIDKIHLGISLSNNISNKFKKIIIGEE